MEHEYSQAAKGLFTAPYYVRYSTDISGVRRYTGHPTRGVYASELHGACLITAARLISLAFAKRRTAYQQAKAFAEGMAEQYTDHELLEGIYDSGVDEAMAHVCKMIQDQEVPFTQAARVVAKRYQQTETVAGQMIRRYQNTAK